MDLQMERAENIYCYFQEFITSRVPNNYTVQLLTKLSLPRFCGLIKSYKTDLAEPYNNEAIIDKILAKFGENRESFSNTDINKFSRFIDYFRRLSETL
jgi:hypothetical protein